MRRTILTAAGLLACICGSASGAGPGPGKASDVAAVVLRHVPEPGDGLHVPEYLPPEAQAEWLAFHARPRAALRALEGVGPSPAGRRTRAQALGQFGRATEALPLLDGDESPESVRLRAGLQAEAGDSAAARRTAQTLLDADPRDVVTRRLAGRLAEEAGDLDAARALYAWFAEQDYLRRWSADPDARAFELAEDVTAIAAGLDRHATLGGLYRQDAALHATILNMFVRAYDVLDRSYWPARLEAARFLAERGDGRAAAEELAVVLGVAPGQPEALTLAGELAVSRYDFEGADRAAARLRWDDRQSWRADVISARNLMLQRRPDLAAGPIARLTQRRGDMPDTLGLAAASAALRLEEDASAAVLSRADDLHPGDARAWFEVGRQLSRVRQYDRAEHALREAVDRWPWWSAPRKELALLLTQSGDEPGARRELRAALDLDPFQREALNYLRLLDELADYDRTRTKYFDIVFDGTRDALVAELMAEWVDGMYEDVVGIYGWEPDVRTQLQIFPTHDRFSVRVAGDPYVGTVGACTGPVIAMVSPRGGAEAMGTYNWALVLRHEFVHTVTLGRTGNRIAHWLTEGLAVREERQPPRQGWLDLLTQAVKEERLFGVEALTWGFVRPQRPTDRSLAYAQSWYVVRYVEEAWGKPKLLELADAFGAGRTEAQAFPQVLGVSTRTFDERFAAWMREQVGSWGRLESEAFDAAMSRGQQAVAARDWDAARKAFEEAQDLRPLDEVPLARLAGLFLTDRGGIPAEQGVELLEALHARTTSDARPARQAARLRLEAGRVDDAIRLAREALHVAPFDPQAHDLLLRAAEAAGDAELAATQRRRQAMLAPSAAAAGTGMGVMGVPGELMFDAGPGDPGVTALPAIFEPHLDCPCHENPSLPLP